MDQQTLLYIMTAFVVLAALLFMSRMAELSGGQHVETAHPHLESPLPEGVRLYEISGSLFFGAAEKAMSALHDIGARPRAIIINIEAVTVMDVSGLVALDSAIERLQSDGILVAVAGVHGQPALLMRRAGLRNMPGKLLLSSSLPQVLMRVRHYLGESSSGQSLLTEKITALRERGNTVGFLVHPDANKIQIRQAVESLLKVKVARVNVVNIRGKVKRLGRFVGRRSDWKKAFVTLKEGEKLELFESV